MRQSQEDTSELLRAWLSKLSEASSRVSENLDLGIVLQEVVDNARYLTGARYGVLLTYDHSGDIRDFVTSGLSSQEDGAMNALPQGLGLLGYINDIQEPLRLGDIASHPSSVGFPENHPPMKTLLGMPIRHREEHIGNIYVTEKEDGRGFTSEDQEVLAMFASQSGVAISNARRYGQEQQAKADLEALINISPVGVVVFDAQTGVLVSANEEISRVFGQVTHVGSPLSEILDVVTLRRVDGSAIPTDELATVRALRTGETVLADEVVIHAPGGRVVNALVNARPVRQQDGQVVFVIATIQDITPLEELKKQRAKFLDNVGHELRAPLAAIKGSASTMLSSAHPLSPAETRQFIKVVDEQVESIRRLINDLADMAQIEAGTLLVSLEPTEVAGLLEHVWEAHVDLRTPDATIELDIPPDLPRVMADRTRILQVLSNILRHIAVRAPSSSTIRIKALLSDLYVSVTVLEEGVGAALTHPERHIEGVLKPANEVARRPIGGDDLSIAICKGVVEAHGGRLLVKEGEAGEGRSFTFTIPVVDETARLADPARARSPFALGSNEGPARILAIVEDPETGRYIRNTLSPKGFAVIVTGGADEIERPIEINNPHVVLLEPALPWSVGFDMLARVGRVSDAPVIFVSGHEWDQHIGRAFELGAFDCIAKPFSMTELVARIDVALRKKRAPNWIEPSGHYVYGDLRIDYADHKVTVADRPVHLTATEYKLLTELTTAAGRVFTHEQLLRQVWGPLYASDARIVRQYIKELRHKLGDNARTPQYIFTEPGVGYRIARPSLR